MTALPRHADGIELGRLSTYRVVRAFALSTAGVPSSFYLEPAPRVRHFNHPAGNGEAPGNHSRPPYSFPD